MDNWNGDFVPVSLIFVLRWEEIGGEIGHASQNLLFHHTSSQSPPTNLSNDLLMETDSAKLSSYRACPSFDVCDETPCRHLLSHDIDYLADLEQATRSPRFHHELWFYFTHPPDRRHISAIDLPTFARLFERCQRITDKREQLDMETQVNETRRVLEWRLRRGLNDIDITLEEIKELGRTGMRKYYDSFRPRRNSGRCVEKVKIQDIFVEMPEILAGFD